MASPAVKVEGYKVFQSDWSCLKFPYQVGKKHHFDGEIKIGESGLHFCPRALDCLRYYKPDSRFKYAKVIGHINVVTEGDKCATTDLEVVSEIKFNDFMKLCTGKMKTAKSEISYVNGMKSGLVREFYADDKVKSQSEYANNKAHGLAIDWDSKGNEQYYKVFYRGELAHTFRCLPEGELKSIFFNKQLVLRRPHVQGHLVGTLKGLIRGYVNELLQD